MRILYSHRTRSADGQRVHIDALTDALSELGHEVLIVGPEGVARPGGDREPERSTRPSNGRGAPRWAREAAEIGYGGLAAARLVAAGRRFRPDILYERYNLYHHAGQVASAVLGVPRLLEVNAPLVEERIRHSVSGPGGLAFPHLARRSEDALWRSADAVLPVTGVLASMAAARGVPEDRLHVVPNGVDRTDPSPGGEAIRQRLGISDRLVLGFVGFVRHWHGVDGALRWLPGRADAVLLLVGDGPHVTRLREEAEALGVADRFLVTGQLPKDAARRHVAAFDIALQPAATAYASPLKLQEYMAEAKAVVAPDQANIRETLQHEQSALLIPPGDERALHAALDRLASDGALRTRLGEAAAHVIRTRELTWRGNAERVAAIARTLVRR